MKVTSTQLMEAVDIESPRTLLRWEKAGVIPPKRVELHPNGIGRIAYWDDWVISHARRVKALLDEGFTLAKIAEQYGGDWNRVRKRYDGYSIARVLAKSDRERPLIEAIEKIEKQFSAVALGISGGYERAPDRIINEDHVQEAIELREKGFNPVLVVKDGTAVVVADFAVSTYLSNQFEVGSPLLLIPLWSVIEDTQLKKKAPGKPTTCPVNRVSQLRRGEVQFKVDDRFRISLSSRNRHEGKRK